MVGRRAAAGFTSCAGDLALCGAAPSAGPATSPLSTSHGRRRWRGNGRGNGPDRCRRAGALPAAAAASAAVAAAPAAVQWAGCSAFHGFKLHSRGLKPGTRRNMAAGNILLNQDQQVSVIPRAESCTEIGCCLH